MLGAKQGGVVLASALVKLVGRAHQPGKVAISRDAVVKIIAAMGKAEKPHGSGTGASISTAALLSPSECSYFRMSLQSNLSLGSANRATNSDGQGQEREQEQEDARIEPNSVKHLIASLNISDKSQEYLVCGVNLLHQASRVARQGKTLADCGDSVEQNILEGWRKAVVEADNPIASASPSPSLKADANADEGFEEFRRQMYNVFAASFHEVVASITTRMEELERTQPQKPLVIRTTATVSFQWPGCAFLLLFSTSSSQ